MAKIVLTNPSISINSVELSSKIAQVSIDISYAEVETTAFGDTFKTRTLGLGEASISLSFHQDFALTQTEATIYPLLGNGAGTTIVVKPSTGAVGPSNPTYTMTALVTEWSPINGSVGELLTADVTWPVSGAVTKATA
jgi:hypothetical protein